MIRVTIWCEHVQDNPALAEQMGGWLAESHPAVIAVHPNGIHETLKGILAPCEDMAVTTATLDMPECGLTEKLLDETDVLIWWAHVAHEEVPDEFAERVRERVLKGMGFIALHSSHPSKPMQRLLGTSGSLQWREGDFARVWNVCPTHPICAGIPQSFDLGEEEMYGEYFDVPRPDDLLFINWFRGGEVFRSGLTWTRGYGRIFYFQPGHETNRAYENEFVKRILVNAVRWAAPTVRIEKIECPHAERSPESKYQ